MNEFAMYDNVIPLLAPVDIGSTVTRTGYVDLKNAHHVSFLVAFGLITSATTTDREYLTIEAATATTGAEVAIPFKYRVSGAVGSNTWGAVTDAAASVGVEFDPANDDGKSVWIDLDVATLAASDYRYVRLVASDDPDMTACLIGITGFVRQRYRSASMASATAAASA